MKRLNSGLRYGAMGPTMIGFILRERPVVKAESYDNLRLAFVRSASRDVVLEVIAAHLRANAKRHEPHYQAYMCERPS